MFKYRLQWPDGSDAGEQESSTVVHPDDILWTGGGRRLHVLEVRPAEAGSPHAAILTVEGADGTSGAQPPAAGEVERLE